VRIGPASGDWLDLRFDWLRRREVSPAGAVLVRPDRVVAWRSRGAAEDPVAELEHALGVALGAPVGAAVREAR
jgi:2,4-dichlorophenol 6-monooxygenase